MTKKKIEPVDEVEEEIKITGEQIELIPDLCNKYGLYDEVFEPKKSPLNSEEKLIYAGIFKRREALGKDYFPDEKENAVWDKVVENYQREDYELRKLLQLGNGKLLAKELWTILYPEKEFNLGSSISELIRRIPQIKGELGFTA